MSLHIFPNGAHIVVTNICPPIPDRRFDWCAYFEDDEPNDDGAMMQGFGPTIQDALDDLLRLLEELSDVA